MNDLFELQNGNMKPQFTQNQTMAQFCLGQIERVLSLIRMKCKPSIQITKTHHSFKTAPVHTIVYVQVFIQDGESFARSTLHSPCCLITDEMGCCRQV